MDPFWHDRQSTRNFCEYRFTGRFPFAGIEVELPNRLMARFVQ